EALKAQAVAARNYAIHPREKPWPDFDICDSQYCQAYYGAATEHPLANKAIEQTQGLVALFKADPILALYSSSHGGHSESYENAFSDPVTKAYPADPIPYLIGKPDQGQPVNLQQEANARRFYSNQNQFSFDVLSPTYRWQRRWTAAELSRTLAQTLPELSTTKNTRDFIKPAFKSGQAIGQLKQLTITRRGVSGKAMVLKVETTTGTWLLEKEFVIRKALLHQNRMLPSANVVFNTDADAKGNLTAITAIGGGFGHGVGMSQYGARYMSLHGYNFAKILQHYYSHVAIGTIPLHIGQNQGARLSFYVPPLSKPATLNISSESGLPSPPTVLINSKRVTMPWGSISTARSINLDPYLKAGTVNQLIIKPSRSGTAKAWIELVDGSSAPKST
ncbi:MAG: SpoIID/LytB domain-containing protein, partial [Cyanobacteria bacterium HKST-UBA06]|nr:SpoIID/LytB domain-containing protein [Cyanobacteria bacterium HKST-UBA06]